MVSTLTTSTTNMTGFLACTRGSSLPRARRSAGSASAALNSELYKRVGDDI